MKQTLFRLVCSFLGIATVSVVLPSLFAITLRELIVFNVEPGATKRLLIESERILWLSYNTLRMALKIFIPIGIIIFSIFIFARRKGHLSRELTAISAWLVIAWSVFIGFIAAIFIMSVLNSVEHDEEVQASMFLVGFLMYLTIAVVGFHIGAYVARGITPIWLVRSIDYVYTGLGIASFGGIIVSSLGSFSHQDAPLLIAYIKSILPAFLLAALALSAKLTRTSIEVFGWHKK